MHALWAIQMALRALVTASAAPQAKAAPLARGPPAGYDYRRQLRASSVDLCKRRHPELLPLVEQGTLLALERPADYTERRTDGYQEPQQIFLVGTAHVSARSAEDVRRVVQAVQPDAVVVELCRSRQAVMYPQQQQTAAAIGRQGNGPSAGSANSSGSSSSSSGSGSKGLALQSAGGGSWSEEEEQAVGSAPGSSGRRRDASSSSSGGAAGSNNPLGLSGGELLPAFQRSMELGGASALLLRLLLSRLSARLAGSLNVQGGAEFIAAREEAEELGAQLVLGDRPIEITLQRAWDALSWRQRLRLGSELAEGLMSAQQGSLDQAAVERLKKDDAVSLLFESMSRQYPELLGPLVHERDLYLAWSLKRSKAVNGARSVVGVVGKGHMRGVCYALTHDAAGANLRFRDLVGGKNVKADRARQRAAAAGRFALETAAIGAAWWAWTTIYSL